MSDTGTSEHVVLVL